MSTPNEHVYDFLKGEEIPYEGDMHNLYRSTPTPDLYVFMQVLEEDAEYHQSRMDKISSSLEYLDGLQRNGPTNEKEKAALPHLDRLVRDDQNNFREYWKNWHDCAARITAIRGILEYRIDNPSCTVVPLWDELDSEPPPRARASRRGPGRPPSYDYEDTEMWYREYEGKYEREEIVKRIMRRHYDEGRGLPDYTTISKQLDRLGLSPE